MIRPDDSRRPLADIAQILIDTPGRVLTTGEGHSAELAHRLARLLTIAGVTTSQLALSPPTGAKGETTISTGDVRGEDLVIALVGSRGAHELTDWIRTLGTQGVPTMAVTQFPDSPTAKAATMVIDIRPTSVPASHPKTGRSGSASVIAWADALVEEVLTHRGTTWSEAIARHVDTVVQHGPPAWPDEPNQ